MNTDHDAWGKPFDIPGSLYRLGSVRYSRGIDIRTAPFFLPDGETIACAGPGLSICMWAVRDGRLVERIDATAYDSERACTHNGISLEYRMFDGFAVSWDGKLGVASGFGQDSYAGNSKLFDLGSRECVATFGGSPERFRWSPDAKYLFASSGKYDIKVLDVQTGEYTKQLVGTKAPIVDFAVRRDGTLIVFSAPMQDHIVTSAVLRKFNVVDGVVSERPRIILRTTEFCGEPRFAMTREGLVAMAIGSNVLIIDTTQPRSRCHLATLELPARCLGLAFSPDATKIAVMHDPTQQDGPSSDNQSLVILDTRTGQTVHCWERPFIDYSLGVHMAWSPKDDLLVATDLRGVFAWSVETKEALPQNSHSWPVDAVCELPTGDQVVTASRDGTVMVWNLGSDRKPQQVSMEEFTSVWPRIRCSADGKHCALIGDGVVRILNLEDLTVRPEDNAEEIAFASDWNEEEGKSVGEQLVLACADDIRVKSIDGSTLVRYGLHGASSIIPSDVIPQSSCPTDMGTDMRLSGDGTRIAIRVEEKGKERIVCFDIRRSLPLGVIRNNDNSFSYQWGLSLDGRYLSTHYLTGGNVDVWDVSSGDLVCRIELDDYTVPIAWSPDGRFLCTGMKDQDVGIWSLPSGKVVATIPEGIWITTVAFSPDGKRLLAGRDDGTVVCWEIAKLGV